MAYIELSDEQLDAIKRMHNGCILCGGVGSGKSRTSLAYYYILNGGDIYSKEYKMMNKTPMDLYIITTPKKRDTLEWEGEMLMFHIHMIESVYNHKVVVDSWNNIKKYTDVENAFFIFDEQRVIGTGAWTKSFWKITKKNQWILLSATPGDCWLDYGPVFVANGYFRNISEFKREHIVYSPYCHNFPKIDHYVREGRLLRLRERVLVQMDCARNTVRHNEYIMCTYDRDEYKNLMKYRWNYEKNQPMQNASELCYALRKLVNSHWSRGAAVKEIVEEAHKVIIFYNFDYELEILRLLDYGFDYEIAEWNGHKHQPVPTSDKWVYLVQYTSGCEGWNCITTDTIIFYSQNYSYKVMEQATGRIDRLNTPFTDLYYYHLKSSSPIDLAIYKALKTKKKFNERKFAG